MRNGESVQYLLDFITREHRRLEVVIARIELEVPDHFVDGWVEGPFDTSTETVLRAMKAISRDLRQRLDT